MNPIICKYIGESNSKFQKGFYYPMITADQGNGLSIFEVPEWGTTYGADGINFEVAGESRRVVELTLREQRRLWKSRCN